MQVVGRQRIRRVRDDREKIVRHATIWAAILSIAMMNASCRKQTPAVAPGPQNPPRTYMMSDGLQITPLEVERDDVANILGIQQWRFRVVTPSASDRIQHTLELREKGRPGAKFIDGVTWAGGSGNEREIVLALYPLAGDLTAAEQIKIYIRVGNGTVNSIIDNPFKELTGGFSREPVASGQEDGSLLLAECTRNTPFPDPNNPRLFLTIKIGQIESERP
jgi:hypothetical protein